MITAKIDVTKIDKKTLYKGKKGVYLDIVIFEHEEDEYGNTCRIVQGVSKEDRAAGVKGAILGNGKRIGESSPADRRTAPSKPSEKQDDEIPF